MHNNYYSKPIMSKANASCVHFLMCRMATLTVEEILYQINCDHVGQNHMMKAGCATVLI